jgi:hypothetical protein
VRYLNAGDRMEYRDRSRLIGWVGAILLLVGFGAAVLGPVEMYCFYLFSEDGRFHFEGFGFGSVVFASIAWQIVGYYMIAFVCIPLGYGHLKSRRWARTVSMAGLGAWLVVGIPLTFITLMLLVAYKPMNLASLFVTGAAGLFLYPGLPIILLRFYNNRDVCLTFEKRDPQSYWIENIPLPVLTLVILLFFYWMIAHVAIFFNGIFPLFGLLLTGLPGIAATTVVIMCLMVLIWGILKINNWAWWATLVLLCAAIITVVVTLMPLSFQDIVAAVNLPPLELEAMQNVPLRGWHLGLFISLPLIATISLLISVRTYFQYQSETATLENH